MIPFVRRTGISLLFSLALVFTALTGSSLASTIEGFVFDQARNPLSDVDVELLNEYYQSRGRARTNGIGRYSFGDLPDGNYTVKVMPFRLGLEDEERPVEINTFKARGAGQGNDTMQVDFYLSPRSGGLADTTTGVIFVQEVSSEAEDLFKQAQKSIKGGDNDKGFRELIAATEAEPTYYHALMLLGKHLLVKKRNLEAAQIFMRAVSKNPKSSNGWYLMGVAFSTSGDDQYLPAAKAALTKGEELAQKAFQIPFELGKVLRKLKDFENAEIKLLRAKSLADTKVPEIHLELAQFYANDLKQFSKAADELESYLKSSKSEDAALKAKVLDLRAKGAKQT